MFFVFVMEQCFFFEQFIDLLFTLAILIERLAISLYSDFEYGNLNF